MTELQLVLLVFAVIFVGALYWWGKSNKQQSIRRVDSDPLRAEHPEDEGVEVKVIRPRKAAADQLATPSQSLAEEAVVPKADLTSAANAEVHSRLIDHQQHLRQEDTYEVQPPEFHVTSAAPEYLISEREQIVDSEAVTSEVFALLVLEPKSKFNRQQIHQAMSACNMQLTEKGSYVFRDANGNTLFRAANVIEPGYFPPVEEVDFTTPGLALVLELPCSVSPYQAMNEFIHAARKISQSLGGKLYDVHRRLIRESELKSMREYAQSITY